MNRDFERELRHFTDVWRRVDRDRGHRPPPPGFGPPPPPPPPGMFPPPPGRFPPPAPPRPCCRAVRFNPHGRRWL